MFAIETIASIKKIREPLSACSERSAYSIASGASNSSYGNSSTATMSNEPTSLMSDDMMPEDFEAGAYGKKRFNHYRCVVKSLLLPLNMLVTHAWFNFSF